MFRGLFLLLLGFVLGVALMAHWWPAIPSAATPAGAADLRVVISDAYLARAVRQRAATLTVASVSNVRVSSVMSDHALVAGGTLTAGLLSAPVAVELQPSARNGQVQFIVIATRVAGMPIPAQLTNLFTGSINDATRSPLGTHAYVTGVSVQPAGLEIVANYQ